MVQVALETSLAIDNMLLDSSHLVQVRCRNHHGPGFWSDWSTPYNLGGRSCAVTYVQKVVFGIEQISQFGLVCGMSSWECVLSRGVIQYAWVGLKNPVEVLSPSASLSAWLCLRFCSFLYTRLAFRESCTVTSVTPPCLALLLAHQPPVHAQKKLFF